MCKSNNSTPTLGELHTPYIIGLTGGIGSGKTTVANLFIEQGIEFVDADIVAREVVRPDSPALNSIAIHFGKNILQADGSLDRTKLREKIFSNPAEKLWLNALLHPLIRQSIFDQLSVLTSPYCLLIAPLLFENSLHERVDRTLSIDVTEEVQTLRTHQRDSSSIEVIKSIIASQISRSERLSLSDDIIVNMGKSIEELRNEIALIDQKYRELADKKRHKQNKSLK